MKINNKIDILDNQIDSRGLIYQTQLVYKLYGLAEEEIEII